MRVAGRVVTVGADGGSFLRGYRWGKACVVVQPAFIVTGLADGAGTHAGPVPRKSPRQARSSREAWTGPAGAVRSHVCGTELHDPARDSVPSIGRRSQRTHTRSAPSLAFCDLSPEMA